MIANGTYTGDPCSENTDATSKNVPINSAAIALIAVRFSVSKLTRPVPDDLVLCTVVVECCFDEVAVLVAMKFLLIIVRYGNSISQIL